MGILYIVHRSPFQRNEVILDLQLTKQGDGVLFIQDGVLIAKGIPAHIKELYEQKEKEGVKYYFLEEDLQARGIETDKTKVNYEGVVDLLAEYEKVVM